VITFGCVIGSRMESRMHINNEGSAAEPLSSDCFGKCKVFDLCQVLEQSKGEAGMVETIPSGNSGDSP